VTKPRDAAILLIGNELLSGRVVDENLGFIARQLWDLGVPVREAMIVRDEVEPIAEAVRRLSGRHDYLFTSGGVGPTHDDVTIDGVARAFDLDVVEHEELARPIHARFGERVTDSHLRMARVPAGAVLEAGGSGAWPTVRVRNVYLLPGVPAILRRKFEKLKQRFAQARFHRVVLSVCAEEASIAPSLARTAARCPDVEIGSYPDRDGVVVTLESADPERLDVARAEIEADLAPVLRNDLP
jgi:molybdenum cofactor synthesis domain-containing protein